MTCTVWKDTSIVQFASCMSKPNVHSYVHRRVGRCHVQVPIPGVAVTYGKYMGGVDKFDAMMTKKLYAKLGTWQLESLETSLVVPCQHGNIKFLDFVQTNFNKTTAQKF